MASSMLVAALLTPTDGSPPAWAAGRHAIDSLTFADLTDGLMDSVEDAVDEDAVDDERAVLAAAKARLHRRIQELRTAYGDGQARLDPDLYFFHAFGRRMLMTGGASWGGPPTELFEVLVELTEIDSVAEALAGDQRPGPPQAATPSIEPGQVLGIQDYGLRIITADGGLADCDPNQPIAVRAEVRAVVFVRGRGYYLIEEDLNPAADATVPLDGPGHDPFIPCLTPLTRTD
jgi:hypothetical protein